MKESCDFIVWELLSYVTTLKCVVAIGNKNTLDENIPAVSNESSPIPVTSSYVTNDEIKAKNFWQSVQQQRQEGKRENRKKERRLQSFLR